MCVCVDVYMRVCVTFICSLQEQWYVGLFSVNFHKETYKHVKEDNKNQQIKHNTHFFLTDSSLGGTLMRGCDPVYVYVYVCVRVQVRVCVVLVYDFD